MIGWAVAALVLVAATGERRRLARQVRAWRDDARESDLRAERAERELEELRFRCPHRREAER